MRASNYDDILRIRVPSSLTDRLRKTASHYARSPSDVVREAVVVRLDELSRRKPAAANDDGGAPPQAA